MWMGIPPTKEFDHGFNQEELQYVLMNSRHVHPSDDLVNKIMLKALRLKETTAEQVMLPREQVVVLWRDKSLAENLAIAQKSGYSRLPYCGDTQDQVLGVIHVKELLWQYQVLGDADQLSAIVRPILTFMAKTRLPAMLELFRKSRNHLALVLDADERMIGPGQLRGRAGGTGRRYPRRVRHRERPLLRAKQGSRSRRRRPAPARSRERNRLAAAHGRPRRRWRNGRCATGATSRTRATD